MNMRLLILIFCVYLFPSYGQTAEKELSRPAPLSAQSDTTIDIRQVSRGRIFLPKADFRIGESTTLDVGQLTSEDGTYFYRKPIKYRIVILDSHGTRIPVRPLFVADSFQKPAFRLEKDSILRDSVRLVFGCDESSIREFSKILEPGVTLSEGFDLDGYRSLPDVCVDVTKMSDLVVKVEIVNDLVAETTSKIRTAVGTLQTNTLSIHVY